MDREDASVTCAQVIERLVEGVRPAEGDALSAHLGSCLNCFRVAGELRDLPQLTQALRNETAADPGPVFWETFPARVGLAFEARQQRPDLGPAAALWGSVTAWFRLPLPAALAGAAVAAAVLLLATRGLKPTLVTPVATLPGTSTLASAGDEEGTATEIGAAALTPAEEIELLEGDALDAAVRASRLADDAEFSLAMDMESDL